MTTEGSSIKNQHAPVLGRIALPLVAAAILLQGACGSGAGAPASPTAPAPVAAATPKPLNIVVIMTDDQESVSARDMPRMRSLIADQGVHFENAISTTPLCGPSRATIFRGQYAHSHGAKSNEPPLGGYGNYRDGGLEGDSLPVWLKAAGYRNAFVGKYINGYRPGFAFVPPGWDDWLALTEPQRYTGFTFNENGRDMSAPDGAYQTDYLAQRAVEFLRRTEEKDDQPFFLMVSLFAPHNVSRPASRHSSMFGGRGGPRTPAFDEADVSDKPRHIRRIPRFDSATVNAIDTEYRNVLRALQSVDDLVAQVVEALTAQGELENTAIIFFSDNGLSTGAHRFTDKTAPYAESLDIPLYIRVPGGARGISIPHLVANLDLPATILDWARAPMPPSLEGRSLAPLLAPSTPALSSWRPDLLIEYWDDTNPATTRMPSFQGVRAEDGVHSDVYVLYNTAEDEYYDFKKDPYQLTSNVAGNLERVGQLRQRLQDLAACSGSTCR